MTRGARKAASRHKDIVDAVERHASEVLAKRAEAEQLRTPANPPPPLIDSPEQPSTQGEQT